ncbi:MAG: YcfL family protein [Euryarchaeota archaeon]|nr:YcfL family protein [Euryarchaeota archaeon]
MSIAEYFSEIKSALILSPAVKSYSVEDELVKEFEGFLRVRAVLLNGDILEIFVYATFDKELQVQKYRFHWQDINGKLKKRWDNAPHHRELPTFPYHMHDTKGVFKHEFIDIFRILKIIEGELQVN